MRVVRQRKSKDLVVITVLNALTATVANSENAPHWLLQWIQRLLEDFTVFEQVFTP